MTALAQFEEELRRQCAIEVVAGQHVVVLWPDGWRPAWCAESGLNDHGDLPGWLDRCYEHVRGWLGVDPNDEYAKRNGRRERLVCMPIWRDFHFDGVPRPFIGLRPCDPDLGSEDWMGWLCHELSHDFLHHRDDEWKRWWGEGMCDYLRLRLLQAMGMSGAASRWEVSLRQAAPNDRYRGAAFALAERERSLGCTGANEFWQRVDGTDFAVSVATPTWDSG